MPHDNLHPMSGVLVGDRHNAIGVPWLWPVSGLRVAAGQEHGNVREVRARLLQMLRTMSELPGTPLFRNR